MRSARRRGIIGTCVASAVLLLTASCSSGSSATQSAGQFDAASYFKGKTIRVITSSDPGGGTDAKARVVASHLGKYIPGNPKLVVSNVTPHVAGMNFTWNAPKDGTVIDLESSSTLEFELFQGAQWNSAEFRYLGAIDSACGSVLVARGNLGYNTIEDAEGSTSPALVTMMQAPDPSSVEPLDVSTMLLAQWLHLPLEVKRVSDSGTSALNLALQRGDINFARMGADWCRFPDSNPGWLEKKYIVPLLDVEPSGRARMPDVIKEAGLTPPYVSDVLTKSQFQQWEAFVAAPRAGGNPVFIPPGTPDNVTQVLRDAFSKMADDPDFLKAMARAFGVGGPDDLTLHSADEYTELIAKNRKVMYQYKDQLQSTKKKLFSTYLH